MNKHKFLSAIQSRVARTAVGASAARGRGNKGTVVQVRSFLRALDLRPFGTSNSRAFLRQLDLQTESLRQTLPSPHWGLSRKAMNLFLMDCFYNRYLAEAFRLQKAEHLLELPLDSFTAAKLVSLPSVALPHWPGVKHLTPEVSGQFQQAATDEAVRLSVARVHLDALWWSVARDDAVGV